MRNLILATCLMLVGCGFSKSTVRSRTVVEDDDGSKIRRRVTTHEGDADMISAGLPFGGGLGYDPYGGYGAYGYGGYGYDPYGGRVVMGGRPPVQLDTPIYTSTTTVMTGGAPTVVQGGSDPQKDAEQDKRIDRVERRTEDLRDVELRQECEKAENKDKQVCKDLDQGGK